MHKQCHIINFRSLHKNFQEDHLNSRRFPGFPGVVDTLFTVHGPWRYVVRWQATLGPAVAEGPGVRTIFFAVVYDESKN